MCCAGRERKALRLMTSPVSNSLMKANCAASMYQLDEPALQQLAQIVRGADTSRLNLTPQSAGLYAISLGLSKNFSDDHEMLRHGLIMYDALYAWCKDCQGESHNWPPQM